MWQCWAGQGCKDEWRQAQQPGIVPQLRPGGPPTRLWLDWAWLAIFLRRSFSLHLQLWSEPPREGSGGGHLEEEGVRAVAVLRAWPLCGKAGVFPCA